MTIKIKSKMLELWLQSTTITSYITEEDIS